MSKYDVDLHCQLELPAGYEPVEFRRASTADMWWDDNDSGGNICSGCASNRGVFILKKSVWKPIIGEKVYRVHAGGEFDCFIYNRDPQLCDYEYVTNTLFPTEEQAREAGRRIQKTLKEVQKGFKNV